jgi:purine-cytosine permease-like protein
VPGAIWLVTIVLLLSIVAGNAINLYSPLHTGVAIASRDGGAAPSVLVRGAGTGVIMAVTGYLATVVSANFVVDVSDFISFLLYIVIPWSAINLVDYYFVRRGNYDIGAIFEPNGRYGRVNWRTAAVFLVGIAVEIPFMNASYPQFEGPVATRSAAPTSPGWSASWSRAACTTCSPRAAPPRRRPQASPPPRWARADYPCPGFRPVIPQTRRSIPA